MKNPTDPSPRGGSLTAAIRWLDPAELASLAGGLLLVPENLHHAHSLEVLANMV
jgi:hypothetical protein